MGEAFGALGINGPFLLAQIVNFLILFVAMSVLLWKPLVRRLDERRGMLEKEKADAAALAETRANIEAERERALEEARGEANKIIAEARERASGLVGASSRTSTERRNPATAAMRRPSSPKRRTQPR